VVTDYVACYRDTRTALTALTGGLDDPDQGRPVPATPGWAVRDVVGHVVGISADLLAGNLAGAGTDEWTAAQVDPRRGVPLADVLAEWSERGPALEEQVASWPPEFAATLVADLATHDLDVRGALGRRDRRDTPAVDVAFDYYAQSLAGRLDAVDVGAVRLAMPGGSVVLGPGDPTVSVAASQFELVRALAGRRSAAQIRAYRWDGDADQIVAILATYPMRDTALDE
jgi:uncharacterized protein (TIGR03083 family)